MPALNTPQFRLVKSRLPRKAQPVPPIYQPEVAARAILFASHHPRREIMSGFPAVKAIVGNKIVPGLLDHYLGAQRLRRAADERPEDPLGLTISGSRSTPRGIMARMGVSMRARKISAPNSG